MRFRLLILLFFVCGVAWGQTTKITGKVIDKKTRAALPFVSIGLKGLKAGTLTDENGKFSIVSNQSFDSIIVSYIGYATYRRKIKYGATQNIVIELNDISAMMGEVLIKPKENPALRIINAAVKNRNKNNSNNLNALEYNNYSKTSISLINISPEIKSSWFFRPFGQVMDTTNQITNERGQRVLPAYISEVYSKNYRLKFPSKRKEIIEGARQTGIGIEADSYVGDLMGTMLSNHNLYNNFETLLGKDFVSPIADWCHSYYVFTLLDTFAFIGNRRCYKIEVDLKNPKDLGYNGVVWIADSSFALIKADLTISKESNINFIRSIIIRQELEPSSAGPWVVNKQNMIFEFDEIEPNTTGFIADFKNEFTNYVVNQPRQLLFYDYPLERNKEATHQTDTFWLNVRNDSLSANEKAFFHQIDSIKKLPAIQSYTDWAHTIVEGHKRVGGFEYGPYTLLFSGNKVEGFRARLGFKTNQFFSTNLVLRGYGAFGFKDERLKFGAGFDYIFDHKKWTVLKADYRNDYDILGISGASPFNVLFNNNVFQALNFISPHIRLNHTKELNLSYGSSLNSDISYRLLANSQYFAPLGDFKFACKYDPENLTSKTYSNFQSTSLGIEFRWAFKELNITRGIDRIRIERARLPEITIRYERGLKELGGDFTFDKVTVAMRHRMNTGVFGTATWWIYGGKIFGNLPYPLLDVARGNQSFIYSDVNYSLMNFYEFVSDQFVHAAYVQRLEGFLLNRIPLIKKLDWRNVIVVKMAYGSMSKENLKLIAEFDPDGNKVTPVHSFGRFPYTEVGYGFENIFYVFQVFAFHRINYLNLPNARPFGLNLGVKFQF